MQNLDIIFKDMKVEVEQFGGEGTSKRRRQTRESNGKLKLMEVHIHMFESVMKLIILYN
jgi:hypothetical protein